MSFGSSLQNDRINSSVNRPMIGDIYMYITGCRRMYANLFEARQNDSLFLLVLKVESEMVCFSVLIKKKKKGKMGKEEAC